MQRAEGRLKKQKSFYFVTSWVNFMAYFCRFYFKNMKNGLSCRQGEQFFINYNHFLMSMSIKDRNIFAKV